MIATESPAFPIAAAAARRELLGELDRLRPQRVRPLAEYAPAELVVPKGDRRFKGRPLRVRNAPYSGLFWQAVDSGRWSRFASTGPTQSGKTINTLVAPALWHLDEWREDVGVLVPTAEMGFDKWGKEILPAMKASPRLSGLLPTKGQGSRGSDKVYEVKLENGCWLVFMKAGGGDENRSGKTFRVLLVTEADKMDQPGETSREADAVTQSENRTGSYGDDQIVYIECTCSVEWGRIWTEYTEGTESRIESPCVHCGEFVLPDRDDLVGWKEAKNEIEAKRNAAFKCPKCGERYSKQQRVEMVRDGVLVHRGQTITPKGKIKGQPPPTLTLGFRWTAWHNLFWSPGYIARKEWQKDNAKFEDESREKELCQFVWCRPYAPDEADRPKLDLLTVRARKGNTGRGVLPADTQIATVGVDLGMYWSWWLLLAACGDGRFRICDYNRVRVVRGSGEDVLTRLRIVLADLRDHFEAGFLVDGQADRRRPDQVWIDSNEWGDQVFDMVRNSGSLMHNRYRPILGRGVSQYGQGGGAYSKPKRHTSTVVSIGTQHHAVLRQNDRVVQEMIDVDHWKIWVRDRLATGEDEPGALVLFDSTNEKEHDTVTKHLLAEERVEEFKKQRGYLTTWRKVYKQNHYLDTTVYAAAAVDHVEQQQTRRSQREQTGGERKWFKQRR